MIHLLPFHIDDIILEGVALFFGGFTLRLLFWLCCRRVKEFRNFLKVREAWQEKVGKNG